MGRRRVDPDPPAVGGNPVTSPPTGFPRIVPHLSYDDAANGETGSTRPPTRQATSGCSRNTFATPTRLNATEIAAVEKDRD